MNRWLFIATALCLSACDFLPGGGGGVGGGSGGGGEQPFAKGYVYVRRDDKNLYVTDERDFMVTTKLTSTGGAKHPSMTKDGTRVVFVRTTATDSELSTVSSRGGMVSTVLVASTTASVRNIRNPVYTPDGAKIVFAYDDGGGSSLGVVNIDGSMFRKLAGGGAFSYSGISMYPDGSGVLAAAGNSASQLTQLEKVSLLNGSAVNITNTLGNEALGISSRAVISPDGRKAAFDARVSSGSVRIFVIDLMTKVVTQLTDYPGEPGANDSAPCWVGNDKVGFSSDTGGNDQVYALPATGMKTSGGLQLAGGTEPWYGPN